MAVAVIVDVPGGNEQLYEQLKLFPEGWLMHLAGPTETGWRVVNIVPHRRSSRLSRASNWRPPPSK